jgi:hypothetical protein
VEEHWVYGAGLPSAGVQLDRPAWFTWLEALTTSSFSYPLFDRRCGYIIGFMTVQKERRQRGCRLRKIYLGVSQRLTQARLDVVAMTLIDEGREREGGKDTRSPWE